MREAYTDQLDSIFADLVDIARRVQRAVHDATESLLTGNVELAEQVITRDAIIDVARERVEDRAFSLLSLQQPVAGDLRTIVAALRMVTELERMGDLAGHVAKVARLRVPGIAVPSSAEPTIRRMAEVAELMVDKAAALFEAGQPCGTEANMAKLTASEASWFAADMALQTHGGFGFAEEYDIERKFRETRLYQVAPISTNLILSHVATHVLDLPKSF